MDSGDTAWVLASAALVLLMTPGLALFYGGMVRAKSVLNMMMMSFVTIGIVSVLWVLFGYSIAFGGGNALFGDFSMVGLGEALNDATTFNGAEYKIPTLVFAMFQLMFAVITPALISGAIADRAKFLGWSVFVTVWVSLVYFPVAHWVFDFGDADGNGKGLLAGWGVLDFAGGTAVHINAGAAGLALALVLGKRNGWPKAQLQAAQPAAGADRRGPAVVRLVRVQRRLGAQRRDAGRPGLHQHPGGHGRRGAGLARGGEGA